MYVKLAYLFSWVFFFFCHSFFASGKVKRSLHQLISFKYYRLFYSAISIVTLIPVVVLYFKAEPIYIFEPQLWSEIMGILIIVLSLYLWKKSFFNYSLSEFMGTDRLKKDYQFKAILRKNKLNKLVRHPLYSVSYLFLTGLFILLPNDLILIATVLIFLYFPIGIYFEEAKMIEIFGDQYIEYRKNTPSVFPSLTWVLKRGRKGSGRKAVDFEKENYKNEITNHK